MYSCKAHSLTITVQLQSVASPPGRTAGPTNRKVELVALAQATALLAGGCEAAHFPVLVHGLCDPLGIGVASDGLVENVDKDHLKEFVCGIFSYPVRAQHTETPAVTASTLLSNGLKTASKLDLVDTMVHGLAIGGTFGHRALAATTAHTHSVDDVTLLGLVSQSAGLVSSGGSGSTMEGGELAVLPAADAEQEPHHIRLLLPP